jgi:hypothetical protein
MWKSIMLTPLNVIYYTILTLDPEEPIKECIHPKANLNELVEYCCARWDEVLALS